LDNAKRPSQACLWHLVSFFIFFKYGFLVDTDLYLRFPEAVDTRKILAQIMHRDFIQNGKQLDRSEQLQP